MDKGQALQQLDEDPIPPRVVDFAARCLAGDHHRDAGRGKLANKTDRSRQTVHRWINGETELSGWRAKAARPILREIIENHA